MPNAVEIWCYCLGISALALIGLFFGFYGVECALIGWAISQMDVGDLNQLYLQPRATVTGDTDVQPSTDEEIVDRLVRSNAGGTVVPFPLKRNRTNLGTRKRVARAKTAAGT